MRIPGAFPADTHKNLVASCGEPCPRYAVTNVRTGRTEWMEPPPGYGFVTTYDGAVSPDGSRVALPVSAINEQRPSGLRYTRAIALANIRTGTSRVIVDARLDPVYSAIAWSAAGRRLFFATKGAEVMSYSLGSDRWSLLARAPLRPLGSIVDMVVLQPGD